MGYNMQVNPGSGDRRGTDHIMDIGIRFITDLIFTQCESLVRVIGVAMSKAVDIAKATVDRTSKVDGTVGN